MTRRRPALTRRVAALVCPTSGLSAGQLPRHHDTPALGQPRPPCGPGPTILLLTLGALGREVGPARAFVRPVYWKGLTTSDIGDYLNFWALMRTIRLVKVACRVCRIESCLVDPRFAFHALLACLSDSTMHDRRMPAGRSRASTWIGVVSRGGRRSPRCAWEA